MWSEPYWVNFFPLENGESCSGAGLCAHEVPRPHVDRNAESARRERVAAQRQSEAAWFRWWYTYALVCVTLFISPWSFWTLIGSVWSGVRVQYSSRCDFFRIWLRLEYYMCACALPFFFQCKVNIDHILWLFCCPQHSRQRARPTRRTNASHPRGNPFAAHCRRAALLAGAYLCSLRACVYMHNKTPLKPISGYHEKVSTPFTQVSGGLFILPCVVYVCACSCILYSLTFFVFL